MTTKRNIVAILKFYNYMTYERFFTWEANHTSLKDVFAYLRDRVCHKFVTNWFENYQQTFKKLQAIFMIFEITCS